ncbi:MAG: hypothetical protein KF830_08635 [Planctomycetes bacterium]|jgi:hypothetical protein|nr:hypothetical protein [Planctomycetota bacterium]
MSFIRRFMLLALVAALAGCASFEQWLDKLEGKEAKPADSRSTAAATPKPTPKQPDSPAPKPAPPSPTWSVKSPSGATIRFGTADSFPEIDPMRAEQLFAELCSAGWTRQYAGYPQVYFVQIDNRKGSKDVNWSSRDRVLAAANGRTFEQETSFRYAAVLKRFGGYEQTVLPGTSGIVPVAFTSTLPLRALTALRIQSGGSAIALTNDLPPEGSADTKSAAPAR